MSRIGAGLVGIDPSHRVTLRPAMTLTAPLVDVRDAAAGTGVGYGHDWVAPQATRLGLLPLGYADGLPRSDWQQAFAHFDRKQRDLLEARSAAPEPG